MATKASEVVEIKPIEIKKFKIKIVGDTPLIMHAWSEKAKKEMLDKQQGKAKGKKKERKNPVCDFIDSMYWLTEKPCVSCDMSEEECERLFVEAINKGASFGFPATAIKQAGMSAAYRMGWVKNKMELRGTFFIEADENGLIEIKSDAPEMREDPVKLVGTSDLRYRGMFKNWSVELTVSYNINSQFSVDTIVNIINAGGFVCGIGEWRPERDGQNGMFHVEIA